MSIPMNIVLDVALGLILLYILYRSWRRGFIASLVQTVGIAAGFLLASFLKGPISEWGYNTFLEKRVERYVADALAAQGDAVLGALSGLDRAGDLAVQMLSRMLAESGLDFYASQDAGQMSKEILGRITQKGIDPAAAIAQVAVRPLVMTMLEIAVFFLLLFLADLAVRAVARVALGVNRIPLVGGVNRVAGLLCGAVYAVMAGYIVSSALVLLAGLGQNRWEFLNSGVLNRTVLVKWFLGLGTYLP